MGLKYKLQENAAMITGYEGMSRRLVIPESIEEHTVIAVAPHALSERNDLEEISFPSTLRELGAYCLHDCAGLRRISIFDSTEDYNDGVIKGCRSLRQIDVHYSENTSDNYRYLLVRQILADNDRELTFHFLEGDGRQAVLIFPDYVYDFQEDTMARAIHHKIEGAGYAYRETVTRGRINLREYDKLFARVQADNPRVAAAIAVSRLMFPLEMLPEAETSYRDYILDRGDVLLQRMTGGQKNRRRDTCIPGISDGRVIRFLVQEHLLSQNTTSRMLRMASQNRDMETVTLLMRYQHECKGR